MSSQKYTRLICFCDKPFLHIGHFLTALAACTKHVWQNTCLRWNACYSGQSTHIPHIPAGSARRLLERFQAHPTPRPLVSRAWRGLRDGRGWPRALGCRHYFHGLLSAAAHANNLHRWASGWSRGWQGEQWGTKCEVDDPVCCAGLACTPWLRCCAAAGSVAWG